MAAKAEAKKGTVSFSAPLDITGSLGFLRRGGDDYLDRWDGERWVRCLDTGRRHIPFFSVLRGTVTRPVLDVAVRDADDLSPVLAAVGESFIMPARGFSALLKRDPLLARLNRNFPGIRQVRQFDLFYGLLRAISAQQINLPWASTLRRRLAESFGKRLLVGSDFVYSLRPEHLAGVRLEDLRALQFSTHKAEAVLAAAEAVAEGRLSLDKLAAMADEEAMRSLTALRGIGTWSAEWILVRCLGRSRVVAGDLAVKKAVAASYLAKEAASEREVRSAVAHWGANATAAQAILMHAYASGALSYPLMSNKEAKEV